MALKSFRIDDLGQGRYSGPTFKRRFRRRSSAPWGPRHDDQLARRWPCPPSIIGTTGTAARHVGTTGTAARASRGDRGTMTSFPGAGLARRQLPAVDHPQTGRRRSSAPRGPRHVRAVARCQVNDDQLPAVDHRQTGRRRSLAPRARPRGTSAPQGPRHAARSTMTTLPGVSFPVVDRRARRHVRAVGTVAR